MGEESQHFAPAIGIGLDDYESKYEFVEVILTYIIKILKQPIKGYFAFKENFSLGQ